MNATAMRRLAVGMLIAATAALPLAGCATENTYWYCWEQGAKEPHHLGHYVAGDHVCSNDELNGTGVSPR
jgi:hypothetical protein